MRWRISGKPELLRDTMQMTLNGDVRTQNAPYLMMELMMNTECRYEAWDFMKQNWDKMTAQYPENAVPRMCGGITALVDRRATSTNSSKPTKSSRAARPSTSIWSGCMSRSPSRNAKSPPRPPIWE